jgi:hypothetical protein
LNWFKVTMRKGDGCAVIAIQAVGIEHAIVRATNIFGAHLRYEAELLTSGDLWVQIGGNLTAVPQ